MKKGEHNISDHGSRLGTGIKQLELVDASNHIIIGHSIHNAIEVGFNHAEFIIRKDIEKKFEALPGDRIVKTCKKYNVFKRKRQTTSIQDKPADSLGSAGLSWMEVVSTYV